MLSRLLFNLFIWICFRGEGGRVMGASRLPLPKFHGCAWPWFYEHLQINLGSAIDKAPEGQLHRESRSAGIGIHSLQRDVTDPKMHCIEHSRGFVARDVWSGMERGGQGGTGSEGTHSYAWLNNTSASIVISVSGLSEVPHISCVQHEYSSCMRLSHDMVASFGLLSPSSLLPAAIDSAAYWIHVWVWILVVWKAFSLDPSNLCVWSV